MRVPRFVWFVVLLPVWWACSSPNDPARQEEIVSTRNLGLAYVEEERYTEAEAAFQRLIELAPDEALAYANLGLVYLRLQRYNDAETQLNRAVDRAPNDADIRLILAEVYIQQNKEDEAVALLIETLTTAPDHVETRYKLAHVYARLPDASATEQTENLAQLVALAPANIVPRLQYLEQLAQTDDAATLQTELATLIQALPEIPTEAQPFYQQAVQALSQNNAPAALQPLRVLHNYLKVTPLYQTGLRLIEGASGAQVGAPAISFSEVTAQTLGQEAVLSALKFTEATAAAQLPNGSSASAPIAIADYDGDEDFDVFWATNPPVLLQNDFGRFTDVTASAGLTATDPIHAATFADLDNDGLLDLYLATAGSDVLFRNQGEGTFAEMGREAGLSTPQSTAAVLIADYDQEGDLDILAMGQPTRLYRNNGDGTFTEQADAMGLQQTTPSREARFADFDNDGDLDILMVYAGASPILYSNLRQGRFADHTTAAGLANADPAHTLAVADYDNDGFFDLALIGETVQFYRNQGDGTFVRDTRMSAPERGLANLALATLRFVDFDNDGHVDLFAAGTDQTDAANGRGLMLWRNIGPGQFEETSTDFLPAAYPATTHLAIADYNEDRDLDVFLTQANGNLHLLRNDGGNANKSFTLRPKGIVTGSSKNNYFGIGAKVEVRAGDLYQTRVVTEPVLHIGLGPRLKADVVRILWTNGVPQNIFFPGSDQDLVEEQILKGSCPFLYTWDGTQFRFATDLLWRSALGMPLGIMGHGQTAYAPALPAQDFVRVEGAWLQPHNGQYRLQLTDELWETPYFDQVTLWTVDHPDSVEIYINEAFGVPPETPPTIYTVAQHRIPQSATNATGVDVRPLIAQNDETYIADLIPTRYQGIVEPHELIVDLGDVADAETLTLFLHGWIFPSDASLNIATSQAGAVSAFPPKLAISDGRGGWIEQPETIGFPMGKNKTIIVDLTGQFPTADARVRIRTNMQIYWDHVFFSTDPPAPPVRTTILQPTSADLHYRGFSRGFRATPHSPHWFDYQTVSTDPKWLDLEGMYTRYGDVRTLLEHFDDQYVIMNAGDEISLTFSVADAPDLPQGWRRDFLLYSEGWLKDGDLHTAHGQTANPLPFKGMTSYPYPEEFPMTEALRQYHQTYNTRPVRRPNFR